LLKAEKEKERRNETGDIMATAKATLERKRTELGFHEIGKAHGIPIYVLNEKANASQSAKRIVEPKLALATYQFMLSAFGSESSLKDKFNDSGKSDYSFWIAGIGRDTNHLVDESQESEITPAQEAEALKLAESGMNYRDIAKKLGVTALSVYYALKKKGKTKARKSIKPRSSALCTFDKKGNLNVGKGASLESTVRVSRGSDDMPLLFFVLRDSYSRIGGARFVITVCNGRQFTPDTGARVVVGIPQEA
jgi:DNA-binding CsgD family transcriptional regulator